MKRAIVVLALLAAACSDNRGVEVMRDLSGRHLMQLGRLCMMQPAHDLCSTVEAERADFVRYCKAAAPWWKRVDCETQASMLVAMGGHR